MLPIIPILIVAGIVGGVFFITPVGSGIMNTVTGNVPEIEATENDVSGIEDAILDTFDGIGDYLKTNVNIENSDNVLKTTDPQLEKVIDSATHTGKTGAEFFFSAHDLVMNSISAFNPNIDWGLIVLISAIISFIMFLMIVRHVGVHIIVFGVIIGIIIIFLIVFSNDIKF